MDEPQPSVLRGNVSIRKSSDVFAARFSESQQFETITLPPLLMRYTQRMELPMCFKNMGLDVSRHPGCSVDAPLGSEPLCLTCPHGCTKEVFTCVISIFIHCVFLLYISDFQHFDQQSVDNVHLMQRQHQNTRNLLKIKGWPSHKAKSTSSGFAFF